MIANRLVFTHKGWFGLCPVYICSDNPDRPAIIARWPSLDFLFHVSDKLFDAVASTMDFLRIPRQEGAPIMFTGKLVRPVIIDLSSDGKDT